MKEKDPKVNGRNYRVPSVVRAFRIIETLAEAPSGMRITELSQQLELPISSTSIILNTLQSMGYLVREQANFRLSTRLLGLGNRVLESKHLSMALQEPLQQLVEEVQITAHAAVLEQDHAVVIERVSPSAPSYISINTYVGQRVRLNCTSMGKVILAFQKEEVRKAIIDGIDFTPLTPNTINSAERYENELERVRALGYAVDDEEEEMGIRCVGAPVFERNGTLAGAISICGTTAQLRVSNLTFLIHRVQETARRISHELGFVDQSAETETSAQAL